jgi:hypothetical protein
VTLQVQRDWGRGEDGGVRGTETSDDVWVSGEAWDTWNELKGRAYLRGPDWAAAAQLAQGRPDSLRIVLIQPQLRSIAHQNRKWLVVLTAFQTQS